LFRGQLESEGDAIHQWTSKRKGEIGFAIGSSIIAHTFRPDLSNGLISLDDRMPVAFIKVNDTRMKYDQDQSADAVSSAHMNAEHSSSLISSRLPTRALQKEGRRQARKLFKKSLEHLWLRAASGAAFQQPMNAGT
jgi:hypothetical protein